MRLFHSSFRLSAAPVALTALSALSVLVLSGPAAHAQANLSFTGGSGSPLTLTLAAPVNYTVTTTASRAPLFVFQSVGDLFGGNSSFVTGALTYRINGGAAQTITTIGSGASSGSVTPNDIYIFGSFPGVSVGQIVTLASGSLTTTSNVAVPAPANGSFTTFLAEGAGGARISSINGPAGGVAAPEPGSIALALTGSGPLLLGLVRRKRRLNEAAKQAA